jgi:DNA-directed RNA polymerase subunit beta
MLLKKSRMILITWVIVVFVRLVNWLQNRFRVGLARMERIVKDRMSTQEMEALSPNKLINARPVISAIREFFMSSQLSQFMDQTNPLSEVGAQASCECLGSGRFVS